MADDLEDDQWLYGDTPDLNTNEDPNNAVNEEQVEQPPPGTEEQLLAPPPQVEDEGPPGVDIEEKENGQEPQEQEDPAEDGEVQQNGEDSDKDEDEDDSDDDVNVVIGDIKTTTPSNYTSLNIKRGGLLTSVGDKNKQLQQQPGKFVVEEFEQIGTINGVPATEFNVDSLEDKPWRKPGADITDYFNYGFNEDTWRAYCERQKRMRVNESGAGLIPMNPLGIMPRGPVVINDNSKYTNNFLGTAQKIIAPPLKTDQIARVNTIQVMTADRREYSRKPGFPDMSVPPPGGFEAFQPEYGFNPEPEPFYGGGYEPTQDSQWGTEPPPGWAPSDLKQLTGPPPMAPPPMAMGPPPVGGPMRSPPGRRESSPPRDRDRDKERGERESRGRSEKPRDRDRERERSHRRERSRSRSRRHRSKSRSPSHRSHKKKKSSRRHEDSD
ncbi:unnamed protein product [Phaedon cochleariae]|uniref:Pre-mRNA polyadenylation factor Fip1 domain-containing protein n=1 Tax=Phaedon cochleariae TaxID=80249 RepID=A0A9P0DDD5_PHACE|nr:unnamed protein product [Phaedon cochleariae]